MSSLGIGVVIAIILAFVVDQLTALSFDLLPYLLATVLALTLVIYIDTSEDNK